jgi:hypothetical protein
MDYKVLTNFSVERFSVVLRNFVSQIVRGFHLNSPFCLARPRSRMVYYCAPMHTIAMQITVRLNLTLVYISPNMHSIGMQYLDNLNGGIGDYS